MRHERKSEVLPICCRPTAAQRCQWCRHSRTSAARLWRWQCHQGDARRLSCRSGLASLAGAGHGQPGTRSCTPSGGARAHGACARRVHGGAHAVLTGAQRRQSPGRQRGAAARATTARPPAAAVPRAPPRRPLRRLRCWTGVADRALATDRAAPPGEERRGRVFWPASAPVSGGARRLGARPPPAAHKSRCWPVGLPGALAQAGSARPASLDLPLLAIR